MNDDPAQGTEPKTEVIETHVDPQLNELIHKMAVWRKQGVVATEHLNEIYKKLEENKDFQLWTQLHNEAKDKTTLIRAEIEKLAREIYDHTKDKHPHPAVNVKLYADLIYDIGQAKTWCIDYLPLGLILDKKFFEKHALAVMATAPIKFVQPVDRISVQIKGDLSEFVVND